MTVLAALTIGAAIGWLTKDRCVWQLAEAVRYWQTEAQAAELDLRIATMPQQLMSPRGQGLRRRIDLPAPRAVNSLPVRALTGTSWWPGWGDAA